MALQLSWGWIEEEIEIVFKLTTMSRNSVYLSLTKRKPFPGNFSTERWSEFCSPSLTELDVKLFLENNPKAFQRYVLDSVSVDDLENLIQKKKQATSNNLDRQTNPLAPLYSEKSTRGIAKKLVTNVDEEVVNRIEQLCKILSTTLEGTYLYI